MGYLRRSVYGKMEGDTARTQSWLSHLHSTSSETQKRRQMRERWSRRVGTHILSKCSCRRRRNYQHARLSNDDEKLKSYPASYVVGQKAAAADHHALRM